jgi:release factor glutamine methyltransferase
MASDHATDSWTVLKLLEWTKAHFEKSEVRSSRLAAEVLLAHVLGCQRIELYARYDYEPTATERDRFRDLVRRAADQEPVAYLTGEKEFYSLRFRVTPDVLIPRPETEMLVDQALTYLRPLDRPALMWDVGTGSGCIAVATAKQLDSLTVLATDVSQAAVAVAAENVATHGLDSRVRCRQASLLDRPTDCEDLAEFDAIVANLPYVKLDEPVADSVAKEPDLALRGGADGLDLIRPLVAAAPAYLRPGGLMILEFGYTHGDDVRDLICETDSFEEPEILTDYQELERIAVAFRVS